MLKRGLLLLCFFIPVFVIQAGQIDSLTSLLKSELPDSTRAKVTKEIGIQLMYEGEHDKALKHFQKAMALYQASGDSKGYAACHGNIGIVYWYLKEYAMAEQYYRYALSLYRGIGDSMGIANQYNNLGLIYSERKEYDKAIRSYEESLFIYQKLQNKMGVAKRLNNIGIVFEEKGDFYTALGYYKRALAIRQDLNDTMGMVISLNNLGDLLSKTGNSAGIQHLSKSMFLSRSINYKEGLCYAYEYLANAYARKGDYESAFEFQKKQKQLNDSIRGEEMQQKIAELEVKYQVEKKEKELVQLREQKTRQELMSRIQLLVLIAVLILLAASLVAFRFYYLARRVQDRQIRGQIEGYIREISLLKRSMQAARIEADTIADSELPNRNLVNPLSDRELEVIRLIAEGRSNKEIGDRLFISGNTVKYHLRNIYEKLDARNRTEALVKAGVLNLVSN